MLVTSSVISSDISSTRALIPTAMNQEIKVEGGGGGGGDEVEVEVAVVVAAEEVAVETRAADSKPSKVKTIYMLFQNFMHLIQ